MQESQVQGPPTSVGALGRRKPGQLMHELSLLALASLVLLSVEELVVLEEVGDLVGEQEEQRT